MSGLRHAQLIALYGEWTEWTLDELQTASASVSFTSVPIRQYYETFRR